MHIPKSKAYSELWRIVDGAVADAFKCHPDYLTPKGHRSARTSVTKRVTGTVLGFAEQSARGRANAAEMRSSGANDGTQPRGFLRAVRRAWVNCARRLQSKCEDA